MKSPVSDQFVNFLKNELQLSPNSIALAMRHKPQIFSHFPLVLWQYGLITLDQLERIWDWWETYSVG
ncbi:MAG: DUF2949 domain-containing protein [Geitlerinemataceae cyanobacterium]